MSKKKVKQSAKEVIAQLKSRYPGKIFEAEEYSMPWVMKRLPTGILDIDIALQGGFPAGGLSFLIGKQGVGKSWMANQIIREQQLIYEDDCNVAWVSTEMPYDKMQGQSCGVAVPLSDTEIDKIKKDYLHAGDKLPDEIADDMQKKVGHFLTIPPSTAEKSLDVALEIIRSRAFHVVVIDSFGSMLTDLEKDKELDQANRVGGAALLNTSFARKLNEALSTDENGEPNLTCVIGINQVRDNMNRANKYSPEIVETGGWALKHARWVTLQMARSKLRDGTLRIGSTVRWEITKQKAGGHEGAKGDFDFFYSCGGIDYPLHTLQVASDYGVVQRAGSWFSYGDIKLGQGAPKAAVEMVSLGLTDEIRDETLKAAGIKCQYR
jgi:recombination protein RecA